MQTRSLKAPPPHHNACECQASKKGLVMEEHMIRTLCAWGSNYMLSKRIYLHNEAICAKSSESLLKHPIETCLGQMLAFQNVCKD